MFVHLTPIVSDDDLKVDAPRNAASDADALIRLLACMLTYLQHCRRQGGGVASGIRELSKDVDAELAFEGKLESKEDLQRALVHNQIRHLIAVRNILSDQLAAQAEGKNNSETPPTVPPPEIVPPTSESRICTIGDDSPLRNCGRGKICSVM